MTLKSTWTDTALNITRVITVNYTDYNKEMQFNNGEQAVYMYIKDCYNMNDHRYNVTVTCICEHVSIAYPAIRQCRQ